MAYPDDYLESLRQVTDPLADNEITSVFQKGNIVQVNEVLASFMRNDGLPELQDYDIAAYLNATNKLPDDIDWDKVELAQKVFLKFGPTIFLVLFCQSLPECYSCRKGAEVLYMTARMTNETDDFTRYTRRLMETAQFVVNVLEPDGLKAHGKGIATSQKIRLIHSTIRHYLRQANWDESELGAPINHEDMLGTLMSFSVTILEGLDKLGAHLSNEEKEAYYYHWRIIGQLMGISADHIPVTLAEGTRLKRRILEHQMEKSEAGIALTSAAIQFMNTMIPGKAFDKFTNQLMVFLLDDGIEEAIGLKKVRGLGGKIAMAMLKVSTEIQSHVGDNRLMQSAFKAYESRFMQAMFVHFNDHKRIKFYLPPGLKEVWTPELEARMKATEAAQPAMIKLATSRVSFVAETRDDVVPQLERIIGKCKVENNAIGFFASLYRLTTIMILRAVDAGEFEDNDRMGHMDLVFARRYLDAVTAWFNGEEVSESWRVAFSVELDTSINVIQHLLLSMNAHINLDLAVAAAEIAPGDKIDSFKNDFSQINEILKFLMDTTAHDIADIWPPLRTMLLIGEWTGKQIAGLLMVRERDNAWGKAKKLAALSGEELTAEIKKLDLETAHLGQEVIDPPRVIHTVFSAIRKGQKGDVRWQIDQFHNDLDV